MECNKKDQGPDESEPPRVLNGIKYTGMRRPTERRKSGDTIISWRIIQATFSRRHAEVPVLTDSPAIRASSLKRSTYQREMMRLVHAF